ncbi:MAG: flap endonuclease-1 [Candidatus Hecatellales archaeon]|nr:MAG: flap endonuclease-1 [Candidatus Hecatellales archaeon]
MGVNLGDLIPRKETTLEELSGKSVAIDAYNALYQFLSIIRQPTGEPLMDRTGRITSHLSGLLYRTANLVEKGIKPVYVFDGTPPSLKEAEIQRRLKAKEEATIKYEEALKRGDLEEARIYAQATSKLQDYMVEDAKRLLTLLGIPWVQAPSEGEAQAAYLAAKGHVWASASQDYDSLLFGAPRLVRNLTITGRRKLPRKNVYVEVNPEIVELEEVLNVLGINREQLVEIGILVGTDYNPEGVKGIGPKTAHKMIKEYGRLEALEASLRARENGLPENWRQIKEIFLNPEVTDDFKIEWKTPDVEGVVSFLCGERDFSEDRVRNALEKFKVGMRELRSKKTLDAWFG